MNLMRSFLPSWLLAICLACALGGVSTIAFARVETQTAATPTVATVAQPARIPFKQEKNNTGALASQSLAALVLAALAAYAVVLLLKKYGAKGIGPLRTGRRLQIVESMRLSRRSTLHIIQYQGEELLFAESEHGIRLVKSGPAEKAQGAPHA